MNGIGSVMTFGINQILQGFNELATGVFGIYFKLQSFFFMPLFGINGATISIIAYNYGARRPRRIVHTLKLATAVAVGIMLTGFGIFQLFPQMLLDIFNPSEAFLAIGIQALRILCIPFPVAAVCIILAASFICFSSRAISFSSLAMARSLFAGRSFLLSFFSFFSRAFSF